MRPRFLIYTLLFAAVILIVAIWLRPVKQTTAQTPTTQEAIQSASNTSVIANSIGQNALSQPSLVSTPTVNPKEESDQEKTERLVREANAPYETPIEFYGRVIDQDSNSLTSVKIDASAYYEHLFAPTTSDNYSITNNLAHIQAQSDLDGRFEISGEKGRNLTIGSVSKEGYEVEADYCPHTFGASSGTFDNPVVFKMWSTNIHEQLITGEKKFQIVPDGKPYFIDLSKGEISQIEGGDLKVWVKYPDQTVHTQFYDWSCEIDVINGGLQLGDSYSMFYAPADGYAPSFSLQQKIRGGGRGSIGDKNFYVMLNNGKIFGRIQIDLVAPFNVGIPGLIRLSYAINPSGSRILR